MSSRTERTTDKQPAQPARDHRRPVGLAVLLVITGVLGWAGSFVLVLERMSLLEHPGRALSCDINPLVSCATVMQSPQASLLGFPNPLIGVAAFIAPIVVGMGLLAGARYARWHWTVFTAGLSMGWVFITWLFTQTVFVIGALCPYCLLVWMAMIPLWWTTSIHALRYSQIPAPAAVRRMATAIAPFTWAVVVLNYAVIVIAIITEFPALIPSLLP
ncbi:putative membrane protein [Clavibacter michiganensis]|uniref:vitamin K epoxide reductase family protein n=1 Tax=Clavibacter michiganensis TaxID=28447 RepID=UPI0019568635|nr:vitamin K epoxide reductase family protein [Clavibacter michiganensis]MBM7412331.1 putative membrane protein [Clavibacter michiganensis]